MAKHRGIEFTDERAKDLKGTYKRLFRYIGQYKVGFTLVVIFAILATVATVLAPLVLGLTTNELHRGIVDAANGGTGVDLALIGKILLGLGALYLFSALFKYLEQYLMAGVSQKTMYTLRKAVDEKISRLPLNYFDTRTFGDVLSRVTNDVDTVQQSLQQGITQIITSATTIVGILIMMISISPILTAVALCTLPFSFLVSIGVVRKSQGLFRGQQKAIGDINGHVEEMYTGHNVIKVFNREEQVIETFDQINDRLYNYGWKAQFLSSIMMPFISLIGNIGYALIAILGGLGVISGRIYVGSIQSFIQYMRQFTQPIVQTSQIMNLLQSTGAAAERIFELLDEEEELPDKEPAAKLENVQGNVDFTHVSFGYNQERTLIHDLNIHVHNGEQVAIVGPTGAGKTTIVNLLMRFYEINGGSIAIDGVDIRDLRRADLRDQFGMVLQDTWLFKGTIRENIEYGRLGASFEEVQAAAKSAHAHKFIMQLPGGYDFVLNEDASNISQGQRQLLTIARAILSEPKILILDEATSSVDTRTEQRIQRGMHNLMKGRTSFVIAHRLSTIKDADIIMVLRDGDIVETGTHQELLAQNGFYAQLYNSQFASNNIA
ncbi:ABC transporter ATP-binding protein [Clostridiaceae bacterium NSJ-31]|uniref:ABC transporter ATP-binding protein n=3 Tax=Ligaoa zhengdingensis TaxID=2763658 RepID=A0A926DUA3_9FIRM|nr:ABC transporter ATP-binding protein [Ligaoa zhengdingensis]MBC8545438.1 ABC transporter ATP-binding protein [Ligaoa zhengdingensis]